jgi:GGDEF domain-containing protein
MFRKNHEEAESRSRVDAIAEMFRQNMGDIAINRADITPSESFHSSTDRPEPIDNEHTESQPIDYGPPSTFPANRDDDDELPPEHLGRIDKLGELTRPVRSWAQGAGRRILGGLHEAASALTPVGHMVEAARGVADAVDMYETEYAESLGNRVRHGALNAVRRMPEASNPVSRTLRGFGETMAHSRMASHLSPLSREEQREQKLRTPAPIDHRESTHVPGSELGRLPRGVYPHEHYKNDPDYFNEDDYISAEQAEMLGVAGTGYREGAAGPDITPVRFDFEGSDGWLAKNISKYIPSLNGSPSMNRQIRRVIEDGFTDEEYAGFREIGEYLLGEMQDLSSPNRQQDFYLSLPREDQIALDHVRFDSGRSVAARAQAGRALPLNAYWIPERRSEQVALEKYPYTAMAAGMATNVAQTMAVAGYVGAGVGKIGKGLSGVKGAGAVGKAARSTGDAIGAVRRVTYGDTVIDASSLLRGALTRGATAGTMSMSRDAGRATWEEMLLNATRAAAGSMVSIVPEVGISAEGMGILLQAPASLLVDNAFDFAWGVAANEDIHTKEWWINTTMANAVSMGFSIKDTFSGDTFRAQQLAHRADAGAIKSKIRGWRRGKGSEGFEIVPTKGGRVVGWDEAEIASLENAYDRVQTEKPDQSVDFSRTWGGSAERQRGELQDVWREGTQRGRPQRGVRHEAEARGRQEAPEISTERGQGARHEDGARVREGETRDGDFGRSTTERGVATVDQLNARHEQHRQKIEDFAPVREELAGWVDPEILQKYPAEHRETIRRDLADMEAKVVAGSLAPHKVVSEERIKGILGELQRKGVPFIMEGTDVGNLGGLNAHHNNDHPAANVTFRKVIGGAYIDEVNKFGGIVARVGGDEFATLWVGYDNVADVNNIRHAIEGKIRQTRDDLGLGDLVYPKSLKKDYDFDGHIRTGALHTNYGFVKGDNTSSFDALLSRADQKAAKQKGDEIRAFIKAQSGEATKNDIDAQNNSAKAENRPYNDGIGKGENYEPRVTGQKDGDHAGNVHGREMGNSEQRLHSRTIRGNDQAESEPVGSLERPGHIRRQTVDGATTGVDRPLPTNWRGVVQDLYERFGFPAKRAPDPLPAPEAPADSPRAQRQRRLKAARQETAEPRKKKWQDIPEEDHSPEYHRNTVAHHLSDQVHAALKASGHTGWLTDYRIITGQPMFAKNVRREITPEAQNVINRIAGRVSRAYDSDFQGRQMADDGQRGTHVGDNPYNRAGLEVPTHGDDVRNILERNYMSGDNFLKWRRSYADVHWKSKAEAEANSAKLSEAYRVFEEEPHRLTREQRRRIEDDWQADLVEAMRDMGAPDNIVDAVIRATEGESSGGGRGGKHNYSIGEYAKDVGSGRDYGDTGIGRNYFQGQEAKADMYKHGVSAQEARSKLNDLLSEDRVLLVTSKDGNEARISRSTVGKMLSDTAVNKSVDNGFTARQHYAVVSDIENVYRNSTRVSSSPDKHGYPDVTIHRLATPLGFNESAAYITVKETIQGGNRVHSVELIEIRKLGSTFRTGGNKPDDSFLPSSSTTNLRHSGEKVNSKSKNSSNTGSDASKGDYNDRPQSGPSGESSGLRPIEMPELVTIVRELLDGNSPRIMRYMRVLEARGAAHRVKDENGNWQWKRIDLAADIFKDPGQAAKVLAHEIGHIMTRYGGEGKYKAIAQKIKNASHQFKQFIEDDPNATMLTAKDRLRIKKESEQLLKHGERWIDEIITKETRYTPDEIKAIWNSVDMGKADPILSDYIKGLNSASKKALVTAVIRNKATPDYVPKRTEQVATGNRFLDTSKPTPAELATAYRRAILKEAEARRLTEVKILYDELYAFSKKWRPFDESKANFRHRKYRAKGEEVFADAISAYINDPAFLKQQCPNFWRVFHGWEGSRSPFTEAHRGIQQLLGRGDDAVQDARIAQSIKGFDDKLQEKIDERKAREAKKKKGVERGKAVVKEAGRALVDKYRSILNAERILEGEGILKGAAKRAYYKFRSLGHVAGQQDAYTNDTANRIRDILYHNDQVGKASDQLTDKDFQDVGLYGKYNRILNGDRSHLANPDGHSPETAAAALARMKRRWGDERYNRVKKAAEAYAEVRDKHIIPVLEKSGILTPELLAKIKANKDYMAFDIVRDFYDLHGDHVTNSIYSGGSVTGLKGQMGTLRKIGNPFTATYLNDLALLRLAARNDAIRTAVENVKGHENLTGIVVRESKRQSNGEFKNVDNDDMRTVYFKDKGKLVAYDISRDYATALMEAPKPHAVTMDILKGIAAVQRGLFTVYNPKFHVRNVVRDFKQFHVNLPGHMVTKARRILEALPEAWAFRMHGKLSADLEALLMQRGLLSGSSHEEHNILGFDRAIENALAGLGGDLQKQKNWASRFLKKATNFFPEFLALEETTMKLAGYKHLKKVYPDMDRAERMHLVRTQVGTSDIASGGTLRPWTNTLLLYSNSTIQGWYGSMEAAKRDPLNYATKFMMYTVAPKAFYTLAKYGLLGDALRNNNLISDALDAAGVPIHNAIAGNLFGEHVSDAQDLINYWEDAFNMIPDYWKARYDAVPLPIRTYDGRQLFIPVPKSFEQQVLSEAIYYALDAIVAKAVGEEFTPMEKLKAGGKALGAVVSANPIGDSSLLPIFKLAAVWGDFAQGKNPYDSFYGRQVISRDNYSNSLAGSFGDMSRWTYKAIGGEVFWILPKELSWEWFESLSAVEKAHHIPILGGPASAIIRATPKEGGNWR